MNRKNQWLLAGALTTVLGSAAVLADKSEFDKGGCDRGGKKHHSHMRGDFGPRGKAMLDKTYSAEEIGILQQARLIHKGNENLKLGSVKSSKTGYTVTIVTQEGSLVDTLELAPNGMPLEHYNRLKERIESKAKS